MKAALPTFAVLLCLGAAVGAEPYVHNRVDYERFRSAHPGVLEPNYLPFMTYAVTPPPRGPWERLRRRLPSWLGGVRVGSVRVFCRWEGGSLPLAVSVEPPVVPEDEDRLTRRPPEDYVAAVERALAIWERDLEGHVSFRRVATPEEATLHVRLVGDEAPVADPGVQVLGSARVRDACRAVGGDVASGRLDVRYRVEELRVYIVDQHGLLLPDQVEKVTLHELGHALGMQGHSPVPADLMFEVARDRIGRDGLGAEDVNSFLSLYALPPGTVYVDPATSGPPGRPAPPSGEPRLALAPHVDPRLGFEVQTPQGWMRIETPYGVVAVDGTSWDYEASFQVVVRRYESLDDYLARYGAGHLGTSRVRAMRELTVDGRRAKRVVLETRHETVEELTFVESGDGRVLVVIAEAPAEHHAVYRRWFAAALRSLEVVASGEPAPDRDYREKAAEDARP